MKRDFSEPIMQLALDFVDLPRALKVAEEAVEGGADWLEAGTPLIKSEGLEAVRALRERWPEHTIVADMKTMDAGRAEVEYAAKAGADIVGILGAASDATIRECIEAGRNYGADIVVDMIQVEDPVGRALRAEELGASLIGIHVAIDEQMAGRTPFELLRRVAEAVNLPVTVAGGINSQTAADAVEAGAAVIVVGGAITKSRDAAEAAARVKRAIREGARLESRYFVRATEADLRTQLLQVSSANVSDALHRSGDLPGIAARTPGTKMAGPILTVRTSPGDWAKPVEAIDEAEEGGVLVIDAGGVPPAVWGELATYSALQRGLSGVVIHGAARDLPEIRTTGFPVFSTAITPTAGEPRGLGEIGAPLRIGNVSVATGDWAVGDDDGVCVLPRDKAVEYTNRAMDVLERENRLRQEIQQGSTLSQVAYLQKWEKR